MKKKLFLLLILSLCGFFMTKNTYAFDSRTYQNRALCGNYEVTAMHADGELVTLNCFSTYESARDFMKAVGADDIVIMTKVAGSTKIIDANVALLDLSVNPETLTYFYTNKELTGSSYTYMDTGSLYGGVDGVHIETAYSNTHRTWVVKTKIGNFTGWIKASTYEIVPITWVKSASSYTVSNSDIRHNYVAKIQNSYNGSGGRTIGPKPEMLGVGTYYSYDGHYFYKDLKTLIKDHKNNTYDNSVNKNNPYYNYYMYLSNHTKTTYSSINIDEYIRNNMGYKENAYGNAANQGTSRLYGMGTFFYYAQEKYGVNAILSLSLSRNETGNGTSNLAVNKNNGFGLNAVDSNPTQAANWYATFASSILGYASKWITYGYAHPRDWRYFGPQFGDKWIGMNVKYASDTYWSEKMAANYYSLDKAFGLQDYNYYQLGVVNGPTRAYQDPSTASRFIYEYPEREDALVIVGEVNANNETWYKVVSDLNIDTNYNEITSGNYNWNSYVYVQASNVRKINNGKNGYISPNSTYDYPNKSYTYDLYIENTELKPKVAITTKNTGYYYDSSLSSSTGKTLLNERYIMVYAAAYKDGMPVSYLVTSDYFHDQKEWVAADAIRFTDISYGKVSITVSGNQYTWVNYNTDDAKYSLVSGLYTNSYVPVLDSQIVGNDTWLKVPVNLTGNDNIYGYTLQSAPGVSISLSKSVVTNNQPVIITDDRTIDEGDTFNPKDNVKATDQEDGDITDKLQVIENNVDTNKAGEYKVTYKVSDSQGYEVTKTITITVKENKAPEIVAQDQELIVGDTFNPKDNVKATDQEDGDITKNIKVIGNTVNTKKEGEYKVLYEVSDSKGKKAQKEIKVTVKEKVKESKEEKKEEKTEDKDQDINIDKLEEKEANFYFDSLKEVNKKLQIKGYNTIKGINNTLSEDISYILYFESLNNNDSYYQTIDRITDKSEITRPVYSEDEYDYTYSWFKGNINLENIADGDYRVYIISKNDKFYSKSLISNKVLKTQVSTFKEGKTVTTRNNYLDNNIPLELIVRSEAIADKTASSAYNIYNQYRKLEFTNNKLHLKGTSYSYGMDLSINSKVERKIIFENTSTYKRYTYDLGSITAGLYTVGTTLDDNLSKDRAWFDANIDLSNIPKGIYAIYISNVSNISDYGELTEILERDLSAVKLELNDKAYTFNVNKNNRYRLELIVK